MLVLGDGYLVGDRGDELHMRQPTRWVRFIGWLATWLAWAMDRLPPGLVIWLAKMLGRMLPVKTP